MNARLAGVLTALETAVVVGIGVGLFFAPLTVVWAVDDGFSTDLLLYWRASADIWFLGHGVPLNFFLDEALAASLGLTGTQTSFVVTVAPLGPAILTFWWGFRMGRRELVIEHPVVVWLVALVVHAGLAAGLHFSTNSAMASTDSVVAILQPTLFLAAGLVIAQWTTQWSVGRQVLTDVLPPGLWQVIRSGASAGTAAVVIVMGLSGVVTAVVLVVSYADIISLYQALQPGVVGVVALSVAQLALLPTMVVWGGAWMIGPGFSLGSGAMFSPLGTDVQALPALPILAALPSDGFVAGMGVVAIPVLAAVIAGALSARRLEHSAERGLWLPMAETGFFSQPFVRVVVTATWGSAVALAWVSVPLALTSGAIGPGRFVETGPDVGRVALWWGIESGLGILVGLLLAEALVRIRAAEARSLAGAGR
jgi:hypothetical protein